MRGCKSSSFFPVGLIGKVWRIILSNYVVECDALRTNDYFQGALQLNQPSLPLVRGFRLNLKIVGKEGLPFLLLINSALLAFVGRLDRFSELYCVVPSGNLAGSAKRCLSLNQCMREISRTC